MIEQKELTFLTTVYPVVEFCIFNVDLFQSLSLRGNAITWLLWENRWGDRRFFGYSFVMLTLYCFVVVYALTSDDDKRDSKRVQRRPIRISLRGSGRCKELNKSLLNMNRLLSFKFFSARSAWNKSFTLVLLFLDSDCLENETWYLGSTVGWLGWHCFRRMAIIVKPHRTGLVTEWVAIYR